MQPSEPVDLTYLLLPREKKVAKQLCKKYKDRYAIDAAEDENLFIFLGDSAKRCCWSGVSGRIPTFRTSTGKMWNPAKARWMLGKEKMASLGFPVCLDSSESMGVPTLCSSETSRAHRVAGNSMHFSTVGVVQMVTLASFALKLTD